jgi:hypothetical protein
MEEMWSMTCTVKVLNGIIRLPADLNLPDGAEVQLVVPDTAKKSSFADRYAAYIGQADDLPADLAANLDHYLHGRRQE